MSDSFADPALCTMVALGAFEDKREREGHHWLLVLGDNLPDREGGEPLALEDSHRVGFKPFRRLPYRPGAIYEFPCPKMTRLRDGGVDQLMITPTGGRFLSMWPNEEWVREAQARHDAVVASITEKRRRKKVVLKPRHLEALDPLRSAYHSMGRHERRILLSLVIERLTDGGVS